MISKFREGDYVKVLRPGSHWREIAAISATSWDKDARCYNLTLKFFDDNMSRESSSWTEDDLVLATKDEVVKAITSGVPEEDVSTIETFDEIYSKMYQEYEENKKN